MSITDVVDYHRRCEHECLDAEQRARIAYGIGCEDAAFHADGWARKAREHAQIATVLEMSANADSASK